MDSLIQNRQYHLLRERSFLNTNLVEDIHYLPSSFKLKNNNIFAEGKNPVYKSFLQSGNVFFPEGNWKHYVSIGGGEDIKLIKEHHHHSKKRITWIHANTDVYAIYKSIQEDYKEFTTSYNKLINTIPNTNIDLNTFKKYYSSLKENYISNEACRKTTQNSAFLTYLLHLSESNTHSGSKNFSYIKNPLFWKNKLTSINEWKTTLNGINVINRDIDKVSLLKERSFIYTDFDYARMNDTQFINYYNLLSESGDYLSVMCDKKPVVEKFKNLGWNSYQINEGRYFITNYKLSGMTPSNIKESNSYTESYINAYKKYCSNLI